MKILKRILLTSTSFLSFSLTTTYSINRNFITYCSIDNYNNTYNYYNNSNILSSLNNNKTSLIPSYRSYQSTMSHFNYNNIGNSSAPSFTSVYPLHILNDNYCHIISLKNPHEVAVVDPGDGHAVANYLAARNLTLKLILITHKHHDHIGGIPHLVRVYPDATIYATGYEEIPYTTKEARDQEVFFFDNLKIKTFHVPCHTRGHVLFYITENNEGLHNVAKIEHKRNIHSLSDLPTENVQAIENSMNSNEEALQSISSSLTSTPPLLFTGDTLFIGGCGRFFEGTSEEMSQNMLNILQFPLNTLIFCAHEYTESNFKFLASLSDFKAANRIYKRYLEIKKLRHEGNITVPSNLLHEISYNLFLTCHNKDVINYFNVANGNESIRILRELKNNF